MYVLMGRRNFGEKEKKLYVAILKLAMTKKQAYIVVQGFAYLLTNYLIITSHVSGLYTNV